jgi:outer membrane protein assembly factor BamB
VCQCEAGLGYEIAPSPITENEQLVFVPTTNGTVVAIDKTTHLVAWKYKLSNALINAIQQLGEHQILVTILDGRVACLEF